MALPEAAEPANLGTVAQKRPDRVASLSMGLGGEHSQKRLGDLTTEDWGPWSQTRHSGQKMSPDPERGGETCEDGAEGRPALGFQCA